MHKHKSDNLEKKYRDIKTFVSNYQYSLRALISSLPDQYALSMPTDIVAVGYSEIWICKDGAVILIYQRASKKISIEIKENLSETINEFLRTSDRTYLYDKDGNLHPKHATIQINENFKEIFYTFGTVLRINQKIFRPKYQLCIIIKHEAKLPEPDEPALRHFRSVFIIQNIGGSDALDTTVQEKQELTFKKSLDIADSFGLLLEQAENEEDLQKFLSQHPEIIYPDYIECYPKFKLGDDYITDFVFLVQGQEGLEYIFVEIEQAGKEIFTKQGQFSSVFTQAKGQLLDWDRWITKNHAYCSSKLPGLYKPKFHLIMSRRAKITAENGEKLRTEFSTGKLICSTYDDILAHFKKIAQKIF